MIPNIENYEGYEDDEEDDGQEFDFELETEPSFTYAMKIPDDETTESRFVGKVDDIEAMKQAITKILNTERYEYEIYPWDYGIETIDLYGMDIPYVMSEIKVRITDAITADDRFESVDNFVVKQVDKHTIHCTFTVTTADDEEIESEYDFDTKGGETDV